MDWNKTKTIFIFVFLILDMFLLHQYYTKITSSELELLTESSTQVKLKENDIKYTTLPKHADEAQSLSAKSKDFSKEDLKKLKNQKVTSTDGYTLSAAFSKTFLLGEEVYSEALDAFVTDYIMHGDEYRFWGLSETGNSILYYQVVKDKVIYESRHSKVELFFNDKKEITHYEQTYLEKIEPFNDQEEEVLQPIKVLDILFDNDYLPAKSEVTKIELGYTNLNLLSTSHVLTPTWHVVLNGTDHLYVNAIADKGDIISVEDDQPEDKVEQNKEDGNNGSFEEKDANTIME